MSEQTFPQVDQPASQRAAPQKQQKVLSMEQYTKELEKMHRVRKLESEIAEFEFRGYMAKFQLNQQMYLHQQAVLKAQEAAEAAPAEPVTEGQFTGLKLAD